MASLRTQTSETMRPPTGCESLVVGHRIPPHRLDEARTIWNTTRSQLIATPGDFASAERLFWLTLILRNSLSEPKEIRAFSEGALETLTLPRHRQVILGILSREAIKNDEVARAREWLSQCDSASSDLQSDSSYRISLALIETALGHFEKVIELLGSTEGEVPIHDSMAASEAVLRANAYERRGRVEVAHSELGQFMQTAVNASAVDEIIATMPPRWGLCAESIESARAERREAIGKRAAAQTGGAVGWLLLGIAIVMLCVFAGVAIFGDFEPLMILPAIMLVGLATAGLRMILRARRMEKIARDGLRGRGRVVAITGTGTKINNVPLMEIEFEVKVDGHPPTTASTRRLMWGGFAVGSELPILWHSEYPDDVVIEL